MPDRPGSTPWDPRVEPITVIRVPRQHIPNWRPRPRPTRGLLAWLHADQPPGGILLIPLDPPRRWWQRTRPARPARVTHPSTLCQEQEPIDGHPSSPTLRCHLPARHHSQEHYDRTFGLAWTRTHPSTSLPHKP